MHATGLEPASVAALEQQLLVLGDKDDMQGIWSVLQPLLEMPDDVDAVPFHHVLLGVKFHEPSLPRASYLPAYVLASSWAAEHPTLVPMPAVAEVVAAWRRRIAMGSLTLDTAAAAAYPVTTDTYTCPAAREPYFYPDDGMLALPAMEPYTVFQEYPCPWCLTDFSSLTDCRLHQLEHFPWAEPRDVTNSHLFLRRQVLAASAR